MDAREVAAIFSAGRINLFPAARWHHKEVAGAGATSLFLDRLFNSELHCLGIYNWTAGDRPFRDGGCLSWAGPVWGSGGSVHPGPCKKKTVTTSQSGSGSASASASDWLFATPFGDENRPLSVDRALIMVEEKTTAKLIDILWASFSEDSLNRELANQCLQPIMMALREITDPTLASDTSADSIGFGYIVIIFVIAGQCPIITSFICCFCCKKRGAVEAQEPEADDVYSRMDWLEVHPQLRQHFEVLGWNVFRWENNDPSPSNGKSFADLSPQEQASAMTMGYTAEMWDSNKGPTSLPPLPVAPCQPPFKPGTVYVPPANVPLPHPHYPAGVGHAPSYPQQAVGAVPTRRIP